MFFCDLWQVWKIKNFYEKHSMVLDLGDARDA